MVYQDNFGGDIKYPWYGPDKKIFVSTNEKDAQKRANKFYKKCYLVRDPDVLDTWFSSGLWAFATLGWPSKMNI